MSNDVVIKVDNVGKKYCRSSKRSMLYGIQDIARDVLGGRCKTLKLRRDEFWALEDISFELRQGECLGIVGANGAGKSTLLKMINGIILPDRGSIATKGSLGALIEIGAGFHPMLSGRENIYINGAILGVSRKTIDEKFDEIVDFSGLEKFIDMPVKHYSSGMYVRLGFSVAACLTPNILLLDEVLAVGDTHFRHKCFQHMKKLIDQGVALVLITHSMNDLLRVASRTLVLNNGEVAFDGHTEEAIANYQACMYSAHNDSTVKQGATTPLCTKMICTRDGDGISCDKYTALSDIWVEFEISVDSAIGALEIRLEIESPTYGPIATVSSLSSELKVMLPSESKLRFAVRLDKIPLLRGHYIINAHFFRMNDGEFLGSQYNIQVFQIVKTDLNAPHRHLLALQREWFTWDSKEQAYIKAEHRRHNEKEQRTFHG